MTPVIYRGWTIRYHPLKPSGQQWTAERKDKGLCAASFWALQRMIDAETDNQVDNRAALPKPLNPLACIE